ncbi:hypothetical protein [Spirochaeta thermophila]|uniref:Uncharacterized protein n=1 Tax=Winmispira thermophila (strain ATCC 49972 / DSM 6192 / RI 19.B1) TaxID=665571 RepID=E0RNP4_WINT6|nr:hypothetical protein [Spirochaeta thermophila]ADN02635.1 hypothetical protein STHERM_c16990 [Spirochaeta thermophila DSM 6192]
MVREFLLYLRVFTRWEVLLMTAVFFVGFLIILYLAAVNRHSKVIRGKLPEFEEKPAPTPGKVTPDQEDITQNAPE